MNCPLAFILLEQITAQSELLVNALAANILVAEDEPAMRHLLGTILATEGYSVIEAADGSTALEAASANCIAKLLLLDLMLPDVSGLTVIEKLRAAGSSLPIIVLSNRSDEDAKVAALDLGADDYVTKPVRSRELLARIRASLRRRNILERGSSEFQLGDLKIDFLSRAVTLAGQEVKLSQKEYALLALLAKNAGKVLTHAHILKQIWGDQTDPQYIRIYIRAIRQKLRETPETPFYIATEQGVGYRFLDPQELKNSNR